MCDPMNNFARDLKKLTGKKKKVDADHKQMASVEFLGGLWVAGDPVRPVIIDEAINACLIGGAMKIKSGPTAKAGVLCEEHAVLVYDGPTDPHELLKDERFHFRRPVKVGKSRVIRVRPIFTKWEAIATVAYEDSMVDAETVLKFAELGGFQCGLGDWRPKFGRFRVEMA